MKSLKHEYEFVIIGGGLAGLSAAVTAARSGIRTALVQDRPVLGGTSSKEIRIHPVGAGYCNFEYSRETGLMEELQLENLYRNPTGSAEGWDIILRECVQTQPNLELFLNTVVNKVEMSEDGTRLMAVEGYTLGAETWHRFEAPLFADCTGDGTVGFLSGAPFRKGCEARSEFGESLAPEIAQTRTMGSSIQFKARNAGRPVPFTPPKWVNYNFTDKDFGCFRPVVQSFQQFQGGFWWIEWGGRSDTIHDNEQIRDKLLAIAYGIWDYLKNRSPIKDDLANFELEWVGIIPGKRESRRFEGEHILTQNDIETQRFFENAVAYGGWGFDDHPPDGFFDKERPSYHVAHKGLYNIPLRCLYSYKVKNLFFAGRNISTSHVANSSTRVMLTCGQIGEAVGAAAATCALRGMVPSQLVRERNLMREVQQSLIKFDHYIHGVPYDNPDNLAKHVTVIASSELSSPELVESSESVPLNEDRLWMFPVVTPTLKRAYVLLDSDQETEIHYTLYSGPDNGSTYPDEKLYTSSIRVQAGQRQWVELPMDVAIGRMGWHFLELKTNPRIKIHLGKNAPVGLKGYRVRLEDPIRPNPFSKWKALSGMDLPAYCLRLVPEQPVYRAENVINPWSRPTSVPNIWISQVTDFSQPQWIELNWRKPIRFSKISLLFDSSLDVHIFSLWHQYDRNTMPSLVRDYRILALDESVQSWMELVKISSNYRRFRVHQFDPVVSSRLRFEVLGTHGINRAQVYGIRLY